MRKFFVYTRLQFKRIAHYAPMIFSVTLAICICLSVALVTLVNGDDSNDDQGKLSIGVVGDFENSYFGFGVSALKSFDSSRFFLDIVELDEKTARKSLLKREIAGYVVIPEGFVENALYGDVGKLNFVTTAANADIVNMFKQEVLKLVSCILVESQKGVYGMQDAVLEGGISTHKMWEASEELSVEYVALIVSRSNALTVEVIGLSDNLTFGGYMFSGICVLFMLLSGIVCCPLFINRDYSFPKLMSANRQGAFVQISGEYIAFFSGMILNTAVLLSFMLFGVGAVGNIVPELTGLSAAEILLIIVKFIPAIALITSLQYLLYQLSDSVVSGVLMQFVFSVLLGYVSGCFYPISFFPKTIQIISHILPSGMARMYFSSLLNGSTGIWLVLAVLGYAAVLFLLSGLVRRWFLKTA